MKKLIKKGNKLMYEKNYRQGVFGIIDTDGLEDRLAYLIDGGIERRWRENYCFDNSKRSGYGGYLIQYTLEGCGVMEKQGICHRYRRGKGK